MFIHILLATLATGQYEYDRHSSAMQEVCNHLDNDCDGDAGTSLREIVELELDVGLAKIPFYRQYDTYPVLRAMPVSINAPRAHETNADEERVMVSDFNMLMALIMLFISSMTLMARPLISKIIDYRHKKEMLLLAMNGMVDDHLRKEFIGRILDDVGSKESAAQKALESAATSQEKRNGEDDDWSFMDSPKTTTSPDRA